jgi:hypothetical protein
MSTLIGFFVHRVTFSHLVISQPGPVELKISVPLDASNANTPSKTTNKRNPKGETLLITKMRVVDNPTMKQSEGCLFVFNQLDCPVVSSPVDVKQWTSSFPFEVGMLPPRLYAQVLLCRNTLDLWSIAVDTLSNGWTHVKYRFGIDSVWTGKGLPREEMSFFERLELREGTTDLKQIRRAYHKKSLQWHPDRWSALTSNTSSYSSEVYTLAVSGAFELIAEAYKGLSEQNIGVEAEGSGEKKKNKEKKEEPEQNPFF